MLQAGARLAQPLWTTNLGGIRRRTSDISVEFVQCAHLLGADASERPRSEREHMKRSLIAASAIAALVATAAPAGADFHLTTQACANAVGRASVALTQTGGTFNFSGSVTCNGATSAAITSLTFTPVAPAGAAVAGSTASCGPCGPTPIVGNGSAPAAAGVYEVRMRFTATGPGGTYNAARLGRFSYAGTGQPTAVCGTPQAPLSACL